jgi:hypothetical protein
MHRVNFTFIVIITIFTIIIIIIIIINVIIRGLLGLVSTIEELLGRKSRGSGLENPKYGRRDPSRWPCGTLRPQKLALTSSTSDGRSVGVIRSWAQTKEFAFLFLLLLLLGKTHLSVQYRFCVCFPAITSKFQNIVIFDL